VWGTTQITFSAICVGYYTNYFLGNLWGAIGAMKMNFLLLQTIYILSYL